MNNYEVLKDGTVISKWMNKPLKGHVQPTGYKRVTLVIDGKPTHKYVHRLVAEKYLPNPENKKTVNHKDGNKQNNHVDNLEWCTYKENINHAYDVLNVTNSSHNKGFDSIHSKFNPKQIREMMELRRYGMTYLGIAKKFGCSKSTVYAITNGQRYSGKKGSEPYDITLQGNVNAVK